MEINLSHFLIVCPLVFLAGLVDAIAGGGGLISLPAYYISGVPMHFAIGTNKTSAAIGTALTTYRYVKKGFVPLKPGIVSVVFGLIGSYLGASIALHLDKEIFMKMMLVIVPLTAFILLTRGNFNVERAPLPMKKTLLLCSVIAFFLGIYDGFYGPGMGTFLMILLTGAVHLSLKEANGICKVINMSTNLAAFYVYLTSGKILFLLGMVAGVFGLAGNYIGARYFESGNTRFIKPLMILVLTLFFVKLVKDIFF